MNRLWAPAALLRTVATRLLPDYAAAEIMSDGRNEPAFVVHVARAVARHRGVPFEQLAAETTETANRLFGL